MKTIYKYTILATDFQLLELPYNSLILSICEQYDNIVLYALVESNNIDTQITDVYDVAVIGTGNSAEILYDGHILEGYDFMSTVKTFNGTLICHVCMKRSN